MLTLLIGSQGGLTLAKEVYSPHLDMHQRLTILDALSTAARQLSMGLPVPAPADRSAEPDLDSSQLPHGGQPSEREVGKSRRWGVRSLAKQQEGPQRTRRNR